MPELPSESRRLARRVVQERSIDALSRTRGNGLPLVWAGSRISSREDRTSVAWSPTGATRREQRGGVGSVGSQICGRNVARISLNGWAGEAVCEVLDFSRSPAGRFEPASEDTGTLTMAILTPQEKEFLDVFLHEATTSPFFQGPATKALYGIGVEYRDISYLAWAYHHEVPRTGFGWGHAAEVAPPLPWADREAVLRRNKEIQHIWELRQKPVVAPKAS